MRGQSLAGEWQFRQAQTEEWLPAQVPGGVHTDLLALGRIPDPFVADNEKRVMWVAEADWEYRRTFAVDAEVLAQERVFLHCDGLDTLAEVTLNGHALGRTENMFRRYEWEVKSLLREGENELRIFFASAVRYAAAKMAERPLTGVEQAIDGAPHLRKAPCQFGWDWGPMLPPIGAWRDIRLEGRSAARLEDVHLRQQHRAGRVTLQATVVAERWRECDLAATMGVSGPEGAEWAAKATLCSAAGAAVPETGVAGVGAPEAGAAEAPAHGTLRVEIEEPRLWWPNGYGEQPLYRVEVALQAEGRVCDRVSYQVGLRTVELRREEDEWGQSFTFAVNGVPLFAKGANWIPADSFPTRTTDEALEALIGAAAATHQNMLRVWGGGIYESERFYDLCDRYGILVWQDFPFACSIYPLDDEAFVRNVREEVVQNVRRLRHRASLALWCGNNEMEGGWNFGWGRPEYEDELKALAEKVPFLKMILGRFFAREPLADWKVLKEAYDRFYHRTLPGWAAELDPDTAYWPSSPSSGTPFQDVNGSERGDAHYWGVWHGRLPFTAYRAEYPRFMSEFGFQALPTLETIRTYADEADWNMTSYVMEHHQRSGNGNGLILSQMSDAFRIAKDFPSLVYLSLVLQAEGIRYGVEHWRRHMERVSGTLYWQLNDCWPVASWSSLDYYGRWKALHYAARRFYAPVLLSVEDAPPKMGLHVSSDLTQAWEGTVRWSLETLDGEALQAGEEVVRAGPLRSTAVRELDFAGRVSEENQREVAFVAELWQGGERVALSVATFVPNKHLALRDPGLAAEVRGQGDQLLIALRARSLARFVELALEGADVVFSDNYFDVPAGQTVTVSCPLPAGWTVEQARAALRVRSLYDSFAGA